MHRALTVIHMPDWFPGTGFKRAALKWRRAVDSAFQAPYEKVKAELVSFSKHPADRQIRDFVIHIGFWNGRPICRCKYDIKT